MSDKRLRVRRVFLLSGLPEDVRDDLAKKIKQLGGIYVKTEVFKSSCTHVVCGKLSRGVKFLGALAVGKWVLVPEYITASVSANEWLNEEKYEWGPSWRKKGDYSEEMLAAPAKWRAYCAEKKDGAFSKWKAAVIVECAKRKTVYKRLLQDGGAKVYRFPPLANAAHKLARVLTHVFVNVESKEYLEKLVKEGFPCFVPSYIGDYLVKGMVPSETSVESHSWLEKNAYSSCNTDIRTEKHDRAAENGNGRKKLTRCSTPSSEIPSVKGKSQTRTKQRLIDRYCFSSPKANRDNSDFESSSVTSASVESSSHSSKCTFSTCSVQNSLDRGSPSLLSQSGCGFTLDSVESSGSALTGETCGDVFNTPDVEIIAVKASQSSCGYSRYTSAVSPRVSPLITGTLTRQRKKQSEGKSHAVGSCNNNNIKMKRNGLMLKDSSVVIERNFSIDTSNCLYSSLQDLSAIVPMRVKGKSSLSPSGNSTKAVRGSTSVSDISCLSDVSSKIRSVCSEYSYNSGSVKLEKDTSVRQSRRQASKRSASCTSSESSDSSERSSESKMLSTDFKNGNSVSSQMSLRRSARRTKCFKSEISKSVTNPGNPRKLVKSSSDVDTGDVVMQRCSQRRSLRNSNVTDKSMQVHQSSSDSDSISAKSSLCFLAPKSNTDDQEQTSRSSAGFTDWSDMRGHSTESCQSSSAEMNYSTSPSCFQSDGEISGREELLAKNSASTAVSEKKPLVVKSEYPETNSVLMSNSGQMNVKPIRAKKSPITITRSSRTSSTSSRRSLLESSFGTPSVKKFFPSSREITPSPCSSNGSWSKSGGRKAELDSQTVSPVLVSMKSAAEVSASNHSLTPSVKAVKRNIFDDFDIVETDHRRKKMKLNSDPNSWCPAVFGVSSKHRAPHDHTSGSKKKFCSSVVSMPMNEHTTAMVETSIGGNCLNSAVDILSSLVCCETYPQPAILHSVMTKILRNSTDSYCSYRAYGLLRAVLDEHPPHPNKPALRDAYLQSLRSNGQKHGTPGEEWRFLVSVISPLVWIPEDDKGESPDSKDNCSLLLQFVVALLESDMANLLASKARCQLSQRDVRQSVIGSVFWTECQQVALNKHCREILDILSAALDVWKNDRSNFVVVDLLLKIVSVLASCLRIADQTDHQPCHILKGERVFSLVCELARRLTDVPEFVLQLALPRLNPPWLGLGVCHLLTQAMDDSLLHPTLCLDEEEEMTMTSILTHDLYLLPPLVRPDSPMKNSNSTLNGDSPHKHSLSARAPGKGGLYSKLSTTSESSASTSSISSVPKTPRSFSKFLSKLNKRNVKGETPLHKACLRNDVTKVREILSITGIVVNARDNYGWTPLHVAAYKGHVNCVLELLRYKPPRTVSSYFQKGIDVNARDNYGWTPLHEAVNKGHVNCVLELLRYKPPSYFQKGEKAERVDLLAANRDGVTPLHEAVQFNRVEVAQLLLQYGGQRLLEARTNFGFMAVDLCETEEIRLALMMPCSDIPSTPRKLRKMSNQFSQGSQDSQNSFLFSQEMHGTPQGPCPSEEMYTAILGEDPRRSRVSLEECLKYMCVLQHKIHLYVTCHKLTVAALRCATNKENSKNDLKALLIGDSPDKMWTKSNPVSAMADVINVQKYDENLNKQIRMQEVLKQLEEDVNAYLKKGEHLEGFRRHIKQICSETDYKDIKIRLKAWVCMCV